MTSFKQTKKNARQRGLIGKRTESLIQLKLPECKTNDIQEFYEELGCPFFDSRTHEPVKKLAKLQMAVWKLHQSISNA